MDVIVYFNANVKRFWVAPRYMWMAVITVNVIQEAISLFLILTACTLLRSLALCCSHIEQSVLGSVFCRVFCVCVSVSVARAYEWYPKCLMHYCNNFIVSSVYSRNTKFEHRNKQEIPSHFSILRRIHFVLFQRKIKLKG